MLYGNELSLVIFELLLIITVDYMTYSFVTDAVITYIVMEVSIGLCINRSKNTFVTLRWRR